MRPVLYGLVLITACYTETRFTRLNPAPHALQRHVAGDVAVMSAGPPARPHVDVAIFSADRNMDSLEEAIAKVRGEAAEVGCDAIALSELESKSSAPPSRFTATCIVYTAQ